MKYDFPIFVTNHKFVTHFDVLEIKKSNLLHLEYVQVNSFFQKCWVTNCFKCIVNILTNDKSRREQDTYGRLCRPG